MHIFRTHLKNYVPTNHSLFKQVANSMTNTTVTKPTLYVAIAISLIIGFLGGVVFSIYNAPDAPANVQPESTGASASKTSKIARLEEDVQTHPDNAVSWANLGHAYFDSNQFTLAIKAYNTSLELHPGNPDLLTDLGVMYRRNGQPQKAIESFNRAIQENPQHEQARFNKGVVLLNDLNDPVRAVDVWEKLLIINPQASMPSGSPLRELVEKIKNQIK
ncbi:MAG: hypothetical protein DSY58_09500 [Desulfobulbus sp.]|nr:MAG: hypothetical protein DSY58_09500 [Desulfobulbus sp.]